MKRSTVSLVLILLLGALQLQAEQVSSDLSRQIIQSRIAPSSLSDVPSVNNDPYGVCGALGVYDGLHHIGIGWVRSEFGRCDVRQLPALLDKPTWPEHPIIQEVTVKGGRILGLINFVDPDHQWARDKSETYLPMVEKFCERLVNQYKNHVKHWEVMNEPDYFWPEGSPTQVAHLAIAATNAIRRADPDAVIFSPCPTQPSYMESLLREGIGPVVDGFAIHLYCTDEELVKEVQTYKDMFARYGQGHKPIWVTETGYKSSVIHDTPQAEQATWYDALQIQSQEVVKRNVLLNHQGIPHTFWYTGTDVSSVYEAENFGLLWSSPNPERGLGKYGDQWKIKCDSLAVKPAGLAMRTMALQIGDKGVGKKMDLGQGIWAFALGHDEQSVLVIWAMQSLEMVFPARSDSILMTNLYGTTQTIHVENHRASIELGPSPIYLTGLDQQALASDECQIVWPENLRAYPGLTATIPIVFKNTSDTKSFTGKLDIVTAPGIQIRPASIDVQLEAGQSLERKVQCTVHPRLPVKDYTLNYKLHRSDQLPPLVRQRILPVTMPIELATQVAYVASEAKVACLVEIQNKLAAPIHGKLQIDGKDLFAPTTKTLSLSAHGKETWLIPIESKLAKTPQQFTATLQIDDAKPITMPVVFKEQPAIYHAGGMTFRGLLSDWNTQPSMIHLADVSSFVSVNSSGKYDGPSDIAADCYARWDESNLYLAFYVTDNDHCQVSESYANAWNQDSIQLSLDMGNQKRGAYDNDDFEITLFSNSNTGISQVGFTVAPLYGNSLFTEAKINVSPVDGGLLYECAMPWGKLGVHDLKVGRAIGFSFLVNDVDRDNQGRNWIEWTPGIGIRKDTSLYGMLRLVR